MSWHVYLPLSDVATGEKLRVAPAVEIRSADLSTSLPSTVQVAAMSRLVSTNGLRVWSHVRSSIVPAVSVPVTVMDGVGAGTERADYRYIIGTGQS